MVVNGVDYPDTVIKEFIGEQALTIDNLNFSLAQRDKIIATLIALNKDQQVPGFKQWLIGTHPT